MEYVDTFCIGDASGRFGGQATWNSSFLLPRRMIAAGSPSSILDMSCLSLRARFQLELRLPRGCLLRPGERTRVQRTPW